jgi:ApbE superfamily uncharacterized protein (UPF0280 family)
VRARAGSRQGRGVHEVGGTRVCGPCTSGAWRGRAVRIGKAMRVVAVVSEGVWAVAVGEWRHGRGTDEAPDEARRYFG